MFDLFNQGPYRVFLDEDQGTMKINVPM